MLQVERQVQEIIDLDRELAKATDRSQASEDMRDSFKKTRVSKLPELFPGIEWNHYLHQTLPIELHKYLETDPEVTIQYFDEVKEIGTVIQKTDPRIVSNYVTMEYVTQRIYSMDERFRELIRVITVLLKQAINLLLDLYFRSYHLK